MKNLWMPPCLEKVKWLKAWALESETLGLNPAQRMTFSKLINSVPHFCHLQNEIMMVPSSKGYCKDEKRYV